MSELSDLRALIENGFRNIKRQIEDVETTFLRKLAMMNEEIEEISLRLTAIELRATKSNGKAPVGHEED